MKKAGLMNAKWWQ